uniref:Uncharacterized protein n=1 Tax=Setaria viridis TaxID=4556 RepID=A0A4U6UFB4_SETVI|nr:hypothetical protein SEVIR_5G091050v2 [Setaria viridis]
MRMSARSAVKGLLRLHELGSGSIGLDSVRRHQSRLRAGSPLRPGPQLPSPSAGLVEQRSGNNILIA